MASHSKGQRTSYLNPCGPQIAHINEQKQKLTATECMPNDYHTVHLCQNISSRDQHCFFREYNFFGMLFNHVQGSAVGTATTLRAGWSGLRILVEGSFFSSPNHPQQLQVPHSLQFNGCQGSFSGVKRPKREVNHSPRSNAKIKNEWSNTSTPPICFHGTDRDDFTFYIQQTCSNMKIGNKAYKGAV
jgi:hypothetical protein